MWFFQKKRAEHSLQELIDGLSRALGSKLISVILYGSKASGEYREGSSDVNVFIILDDVTTETLEQMAVSFRTWTKAGHPMPVFVQKNELVAYAKGLPVEFLDMQDHHKVIFGSDLLADLRVDSANLRSQCLQELCTKQLKLRQSTLLADANVKKLRTLLLDSLPSVLTLYRAVLRLESDVPKGSKIAAARVLSERAGLDGDCLERLWNNHIRRQADNIRDIAQRYLDDIERVIAYVGRK